jgi:hypothetical protein
MNIDVKILKKVQANQIQYHYIMRLYIQSNGICAGMQG